MKKFFFIAAITIGGAMCAKGKSVINDAKFLPVRIVTSCGYVEYVDFNPASDNPACAEVDARYYEDVDCNAPVEAWGYA